MHSSSEPGPDLAPGLGRVWAGSALESVALGTASLRQAKTTSKLSVGFMNGSHPVGQPDTAYLGQIRPRVGSRVNYNHGQRLPGRVWGSGTRDL